VSDPDGNDGLLPSRVGHRAPVSEGDSGRAGPPAEAKKPDGGSGDGPGSGKRRRRRRRARKNRASGQSGNGSAQQSGKTNASGAPGLNGQTQGQATGRTGNGFDTGASAPGLNGTAVNRVPGNGNTGLKGGSAPHPAENRSDRFQNKRSKGRNPRSQDNDQSEPARDANGQEQKHRGHKRNGHRYRHRHPMRREPQNLYAALDLGTNNCRLLIAEPRGRGFKVVDAFSRIVRLGEGMAQNGALRLDAMERAIDALRVCRRKLDHRGVEKVRLVATEACRAADNGQVFLDRVRDEANLNLEVLSRGGEAKLAVIGCSPLIDHRDDGALLFDIGGGSSEIAWIDLKKRHRDRNCKMTDCILNWTSLPVGVVSLSEKFGGVDVTPDVFEDMIAYVDGLLDEAGKWGLLAKAIANGRAHFIGTSGTVTTIAGVHLELDRYDRRLVDGIWLNDGKIDDVMRSMLAMTYPERVGNACIGQDRADLVLGGCAILEAIRRRWPCKRLRVADRGLREGILLEMMMADGVWDRQPRRQRAANP